MSSVKHCSYKRSFIPEVDMVMIVQEKGLNSLVLHRPSFRSDLPFFINYIPRKGSVLFPDVSMVNGRVSCVEDFQEKVDQAFVERGCNRIIKVSVIKGRHLSCTLDILFDGT